MKHTLLAILTIVAVHILGFTLSWALTCGLIYLVTLCFGWEFSWLASTGIWLILVLIRSLITRK